MSNVNIMQAVDNIRSGTNVYTPLVEVIVNAIQAIEATARVDGRVTVLVNRSIQAELDDEPRAIAEFTVTGKTLDCQVCHIWTVEGGKVTRFQQYVDTAQLQDVMGARSG